MPSDLHVCLSLPSDSAVSGMGAGLGTSSGAGPSSGGGGADITSLGAGPVKMEDKERRTVALQILHLLLESRPFQPHLLTLLTAR